MRNAMGSTFKRPQFSVQFKFFLVIVIVVFPIMGVIFTWVGVRSEQQAGAQIVNQARVLARQIILTRQWVSDCGGILVNRNSRGAADAAYFFDDRVETGRGTFQRYTPSMVTTKLSKYSLSENLYSFRLASLNPMNPDNRPDDFEKAALLQFIREGMSEFYHFQQASSGATFQYSVPLLVDDSCLKCHRGQGFEPGSIGGCLSIVFPHDRIKTALFTDHLRMAGAGLGLILLTSLTLFFMLRRVVIRPLKNLEEMTNQITDGNLAAQVNIDSGDEFARLGRAFNAMGRRLAQSHEKLEKKIARATSDLEAANQELQKLDKMKTDFFADMSHELRSPITAIQGGVDYLGRTVEDPDCRSYLAIMRKNSLRLVRLVSDLLDLTKIEAGKVSWNFEESDLAELAQEVLEIMRLQANGKNVRLSFSGPGAARVVMDLERIEQVLVNLLDNAIKFSPTGSRVEIELSTADGQARVSVSDEGIGIPPKNLEKVFKKFYALPSSSGTHSVTGTGLGLTICKKIVEAHGGRIAARCRNGGGSVFFFTLKLACPGGT
jgi:signal transduction histidine kinase